MTNKGVSCNVCECVHNEEGCRCKLENINVTCEHCGAVDSTAVPTPHFCKDYRHK